MEELYKSRRIHREFQLNIETDCWIPIVDISWDEDGKQIHQFLRGPKDRFKIIDEAEIYAVEMAKKWIDAEVKDTLTR